MVTRRKLLASIGTVTIGTGTASGLAPQDEQANQPQDEQANQPQDDVTPQDCLLPDVEDNKTSKKVQGVGTLWLTTSAREWTHTGDNMNLNGWAEVTWGGNPDIDANSITLYVTVSADGLFTPRISSAPNRFNINKNDASFSTSNSNSNSMYVSYGTVTGHFKYNTCGPDMSHNIQAVVDYGSGQAQVSHKLNPYS